MSFRNNPLNRNCKRLSTIMDGSPPMNSSWYTGVNLKPIASQSPLVLIFKLAVVYNTVRHKRGKYDITIFNQGQDKKNKNYIKSHISLFFIKSFNARYTILATNLSQIISIQYLEEKSAVLPYFRKYLENAF